MTYKDELKRNIGYVYGAAVTMAILSFFSPHWTQFIVAGLVIHILIYFSLCLVTYLIGHKTSKCCGARMIGGVQCENCGSDGK